MTAPAGSLDTGFFGHPRGLSTLFFTEMWERFSYYGMRALLILFMTASLANGGLGFDTATAGAIYGLYTSMVYMTTLPGGWIADRLIGQRRAVLYGGIIIASGHFCMAFSSLATFYIGLFLIVIGTGLLKGNVSVIVGRLYATGDIRRDAGFSIFYMGINLGAGISPLVCGYLGQNVNWHVGFATAGVGMTLGIIQYVLGSGNLGDAGLLPVPAESPEAGSRLRRNAAVIGGLLLVVLVAFGVGASTGAIPITALQVANAAGVLLLAIVVIFFGWLFTSGNWTAEERKKLYAIGALFLAAGLFWSVFEQAGSTLNLFADRNTHNVIFGWSYPSSWFQSLNSAFLVIFAPVFAWIWLRLARSGREPSSPAKFAAALILVGAGFAILIWAAKMAEQGVQVSPMWLTVVYFLHTCGELCLSPVGLSAMTKLAPVRITGLMMGVWFLATSVGNFIGGRVSGFYESWALHSLFGAVGMFAIGAGILLFLFVKPIKKLMGEVN
jgi:POT family proton-dependent oligopeptide transporter